MGRSKNDGFNTIIETKSSEEKKSMHQEKVVVVEKKEDTMKSNKQLVGEENERLTESKYLSSQKKDISYFSFKNIRDRYQFKEQRAIKIQSKFESIHKELVLPPINSNNRTLSVKTKKVMDNN